MLAMLRALFTVSVALASINASPIAERAGQISCTKNALLSDVPGSEFSNLYDGKLYLDISTGLKDSAGRSALAVNRKLNSNSPQLKSLEFGFYACNSTHLGHKNAAYPPHFPAYNSSDSDDYQIQQYELYQYYGQIRRGGKCLTLEHLDQKSAAPLVLDTCRTAEDDGLKNQLFQYQRGHGYYPDGAPLDQNTMMFDGGNANLYVSTNFSFHGKETYGVYADHKKHDGQIALILFGPDSPGD